MNLSFYFMILSCFAREKTAWVDSFKPLFGFALISISRKLGGIIDSQCLCSTILEVRAVCSLSKFLDWFMSRKFWPFYL